MKSLSLKRLEQDKIKLEQLIRETQIQLYHFVGVFSYLEDNIKELKEVEDARTRIDK